MKAKTFLGILGLVVWAVPVAALAKEHVIKIDLANHGAEEVYSFRPDDTVTKVEISNRLPNSDYSVSIEKRRIPIQPLSTDVFGFAGGPLRPAGEGDAPDPCAPLNAALGEAKNEKDVAKALAVHRGLQDQCRDIVALTRRSVDVPDGLVEKGQELIITVTRSVPSDETWKHILRTGSVGEWRTSYGFTFVPNQDKEYFSQANDDGETFAIMREEDREDLDFLPSVAFTWFSPERNFGWVFGLGYDLDNVALLVGGGYTIRENIILTAGLAIHERTELAGKFKAGSDGSFPTIKENLSSDQLLEETFVPNAYFGVTFRFGTNVHAERAAAAGRIAKAQADAAKAKKEAADAEAKAKKAAENAADKKTAEDAAALKAAKKNLCEKQAAEKLAKAEVACDEKEDDAKAGCLKVAKATAETEVAACAVDS